MHTVNAYGNTSPDAPLGALSIPRRQTGENDVNVEIYYCGVCHSDIHTARSEWGPANYPVVPGHEIIGRVVEKGSHVTRFEIGDWVGVGCLVDSCRSCPSCNDHLEQYCENNATFTYNSPDKIVGGYTYGGYSESIVVNQDFVLSIPNNMDMSRVAPLLCAGITTWSPLAHWQIKKGDKVGVIGLGGLGHMGIKFANALGAHVVMITTNASKGQDARKLGAHEVLLSTDEAAMLAQKNSFDFLLNTIPVGHDVDPYIKLLKRDKTMVLVGAIEPLTAVNSSLLVTKRKHLAGSLIGGIKETQEMLDFCGEHNILPEVEIINIESINEAWDRVVKADIKYRFVIDMQSLKSRTL